MSTAKTCGCTTESCGCCEGTQILTPVSTYNRPGLTALQYRVGTHGAFFETMKARLATMAVEVPAPDGTTVQTLLPLAGLTTRDSGDPSIALLDGWASVADVLTFYQERIANEGYLRTATERRSVLELARLVGYTLRPGVAATVFLAYLLDPNQTVPVDILTGARSQSIPGPGETAQSFETSDDFEAHSDWNNLQVRLTEPQDITFQNALSVAQIYVAGTSTNVKTGDSLLLSFGSAYVIRKVTAVNAQFDTQRTLIVFQTVPQHTFDVLAALVKFLEAIQNSPHGSTSIASSVLETTRMLIRQIYLGVAPSRDWPEIIFGSGAGRFPEWEAPFAEMGNVINPEGPIPPDGGGTPVAVLTNPSLFITPLLAPPVVQSRSSLQLPRSLAVAFQPKADLHAQLLVKFAPQVRNTFYTAWANANVNETPRALEAVYAFRVEASPFGASVPKMASYGEGGQLNQPQDWDEWTLDTEDQTRSNLFLDQAYEAILPGAPVMIQNVVGGSLRREVGVPFAAQSEQRTAYGTSGKTTHLTFSEDWRPSGSGELDELRKVLVRAQAEELTLIEQPISGDVQGQEIELDEIYNDLTSGRWIILTGERTDIPGVAGVTGTELLMVSGLRQDFDPNLAGDKTHTTLQLATDTAYSYKRDPNLKIYGNVVKATHGETRTEILGSGDGAKELQSFTLKQPPLTFVPAVNPSGIASTLQIFVNNLEWHEADTLAGLGPKDRNFVTQTGDDDKATVIFGNGIQGARLPSGVQNVVSVYRNGIGKPGNVDAGQISMLQTRPLGVKSVINPLRASGGADRESIDQARGNAPLAVMALDRLVSIEDYADFSRTFAGIGKAASRRLSDGRQELVEVTIAGADDALIDVTSDLYQNLSIALSQYGDPALPVQVDLRELVVLVVSAKVALKPDYLWDPVALAVRTAILDRFGFEKRSFGQPALLSELIAVMQNVEGVAFLDVDAFGGIPEKVANPDGTRRLLTLDEMAARVAAITGTAIEGLEKQTVAAGVPPKVDINSADFEKGAVRPAQLAIFTDAVQDTIVLNQLK